MGSAIGSVRTAAKRRGMSEDEYRARLSAGEKWCVACKVWHPRVAFRMDLSRPSGLDARCLTSKATRARHTYWLRRKS
jgi:hypothetical protein